MSQDTTRIRDAKRLILDFYADLDAAGPNEIETVLARYTPLDYHWRGMHPFYEQNGSADVARVFWMPLREAFAPIQRRPDVFLAGINDVDSDSIWVFQMGHLLGLFDNPWLGIPPTNKMAFVRYGEFHKVQGGKISETALFVDVIGVMRLAGHYPLPPQTGASHLYPGPKTHDGLLFEPGDAAEGETTMALVNQMIDDLDEANRIAAETGSDRVPPEVLAKSWHHDMVWSGPEGIGASYTIERYQQQHQYPFRFNLTNKVFNGHIARIAEGNYACFFGWANLTNTASGGFLGMTANDTPADMRVVDVYRREGDKLAENWVFIDLLHWLSMQGLDVLQRMRRGLGLEEF